MLPTSAFREASNDRLLIFVLQVEVARRKHVSPIVQDKVFVNPEHVNLRSRSNSSP